MENSLKGLTRISRNRALLVLCTLGFLCVSFGVVSAQNRGTGQKPDAKSAPFKPKKETSARRGGFLKVEIKKGPTKAKTTSDPIFDRWGNR